MGLLFQSLFPFGDEGNGEDSVKTTSDEGSDEDNRSAENGADEQEKWGNTDGSSTENVPRVVPEGRDAGLAMGARPARRVTGAEGGVEA